MAKNFGFDGIEIRVLADLDAAPAGEIVEYLNLQADASIVTA